MGIPAGSARASHVARARTIGLAALGAVALALTVLAPARAYINHVVQPGETLSNIANDYGYSVETLVELNGLANPDLIEVGTVIRIPDSPGYNAPSSRVHTVFPGESISVIADEYGVRISDLLAANGLDLSSVIVPGQALVISGVSPSGGGGGGGGVYVVQPGDSIFAIAQRFGVSMETLADANGLGSVYDVIIPGQSLTIPGFGGGSIPASQPSTASRHEVMAGETLFSIAQQYGTSVAAIAGLNDILDENNIYIGSVLLIPSNGYGPSAPAPTGAAVAQSPSAWITYTVQLGDTLSGIAERYGVTLGSIVDANGIADPNNVPVGTVLDIPGVHGGNGGTTAVSSPSSSPGLVHVVEAGEGLYEIAEQYGVSAESIVEANGFESLDVAIHPGQVLAIPGGGTGVRWTNVQELSQAEYEQILDDAADEFGISRALIKAQAWIESGWQMSIVSHADAFGIMQIIPSTAEWAVLFLVPDAADWQTNARSNARLGVAIMHHWLLQSDWDVEVALASYYQGWDSLHEIGLYEDTKSYISAVLAFVPYFE